MLRSNTNPNLTTTAVLSPLKLVVSGDSVRNVSSLDPKLPKPCVSNDSINIGPWGLSKNTSGFSDTLPNSVSYTRKGYAEGLLDFNSACARIKVRRSTSSYIFIEKLQEDGSTHIIKAKTSIRGNDVYRARVWNRHKELLSFCELNSKISYIIPSAAEGFTSNILKFTLTVKPSSWERDEFNSWYSNYFYDLFIKRIRNLYPGVVVAKSLEVSTKRARGYLHINVVALFPEHDFPVYHHSSRMRVNRKGEPVKTWRLKTYEMKQDFDDMWDCGHVDVRAIDGPHDLAEYTLKYHLKEFTDPQSHETQDLTLSVLSLYDKRCFSFPRASEIRGTQDFTETVINYTVGLDQGTVFFPRLDIIPHNSLECRFLGHFLDVHDNFNGDLWFEIVDHPPPEIDPSIFGSYSLDLPVNTISTFDTGTRMLDGLWIQSSGPCVKHHRLLGNSKKYSDLKELYGGG